MAGPQRSNVPFVLTAGFAIGIGLGWLMFHDNATRPPVPVLPVVAPKPEADPTLRKDAGTLADVERTFQRWGGYAVWEHDVTEVALWSMQHQKHDDYYEVRRSGGMFYFRTLPQLTRPLIDHGARARRTIAFTETQALHDYFHRDHPDYDPMAEPEVDLPPRPPELYERTDLSNPEPSTQLTPGAGA